MPKKLTLARLREVLDYCPETGVFRWKVSKKGRFAKPGAIAGAIDKDGYRIICVDQKMCRAARLAWFYVHGEWPNGEADHKDTDRSNDRIENLRDATKSQNMRNARPRNPASGLKGAFIDRRRGGFVSRIKVGKRYVSLGSFTTAEEAHAAYSAAAEKHYGEFARVA